MLFTRDRLDALLALTPADVAGFCSTYFATHPDPEVNTRLYDHMDEQEPFSRKDLCGYLGIGESTMVGWLKENRVPLMAKEALMLPLVLRVLGDEIKRLRDDAERARILKNGDIYQICRFVPDAECGEAIGVVIADNIVDPQHARYMLAGFKALRLLSKCDDVIKSRMDELRTNLRANYPEFQTLEGIQEDSHMCQLYASNYEKWRDAKKPLRDPVTDEIIFDHKSMRLSDREIFPSDEDEYARHQCNGDGEESGS